MYLLNNFRIFTISIIAMTILSCTGINSKNSMKKATNSESIELFCTDYLDRANIFYKDKNLDSAFKYYNIAEKKGCNSAGMYNDIGDILYKWQDKNAINYFYKALALEKTEPIFYYNIATYYYGLHEYDSVKKYLPFLEKGPEKNVYQAQTYLNFGVYDSAIICFNRAYADDNNCRFKFKIALCYYYMKKYKDVIKIYNDIGICSEVQNNYLYIVYCSFLKLNNLKKAGEIRREIDNDNSFNKLDSCHCEF